MDELQKAIDAWAAKYAALYEKHGRAEGPPETWCNDIMLENLLDDDEAMAALQRKLEDAFRKAVG
jgi:hypothetical protein